MSGRIIPTILGKEWRYPGIGPPPPCWSLEGPWNHPGLLGVSFSLLIEDSLRDQLVKNLPAMQETLIQFLGWKDLPEKRQAAHTSILGLPCVSAGKESACNAGDLGSIPGLGRSPGERNGYPLQYSCLENSMDCIVHGVRKSQALLNSFHSL